MMSDNSEYRQMRECAFAYITKYRVSSGKLRTYLRQKNYPTEDIERLIADLVELKYLDDYKLAQRILAACQGRRSRGLTGMKYALVKRGIAAQVIKEVLAEYTETYDEAAAIETFLELNCRKELELLAATATYPERQKILHKVLGKALRKGFKSGHILKVLDRLNGQFTTFDYSD